MTRAATVLATVRSGEPVPDPVEKLGISDRDQLAEALRDRPTT